MHGTLGDVIEKRRARATRLEKMNGLLNAAAAAGRNLSGKEQQTFNELEREAARLERDAEAIEGHLAREAGFTSDNDFDPRLAQATPGQRGPSSDVLAREERMVDYVRERGGSAGFEGVDPKEFSLGKFLRGVVAGDWRDAELEQRALSIGVNTAGGYLLPSPLYAQVIDRVRNASRVFQAGAITVPMGVETL